MGASVVPLRGSEDIMWTVKFRSGMVKRFKFPIRTTPEGTAKPDGGYRRGHDRSGQPVPLQRARGLEARRAAHNKEVNLGR